MIRSRASSLLRSVLLSSILLMYTKSSTLAAALACQMRSIAASYGLAPLCATERPAVAELGVSRDEAPLGAGRRPPYQRPLRPLNASSRSSRLALPRGAESIGVHIGGWHRQLETPDRKLGVPFPRQLS